MWSPEGAPTALGSGTQIVSVGRPQCLWHCGLMANRSELARSVGLCSEAPVGLVLSRLYDRLGEDCCGSIHGDLAWVVWDEPRRTLVACRDRLGVQPLYHCVSDGGVIVASSVAALPSGFRDSAPEVTTMASYLAGYYLPEGVSFLQSVHTLEPASVLVATSESVRIRRYWTVDRSKTLRLPADEDYVEAYLETLQTVVSDYAPGPSTALTVSSGMDSTTIAAILAESSSAEFTALRFTSPSLPSANEDELSSEVCRHLNILDIELRVDHHWPLSREDGLVCTSDRPVAAYYPEVWRSCFECLQENGIEVLLTGTGGDNLFGANSAYPDLLLTGRWLELARQLRSHFSWTRTTRREILKVLLARPIYYAYVARQRSRQPTWLADELWEENRDRRIVGRFEHLPGRAAQLEMICSPHLTSAVETLTMQADLFGIKVRHPLLDHRLLEFAATLPIHQVLRAGERKVVMREAMRDRLPRAILNKKYKTLPSDIFDRGIKERGVRRARGLLTDMRAAEIGVVDERIVRDWYEGYLEDRNPLGRLYETLALESWLRRYHS